MSWVAVGVGAVQVGVGAAQYFSARKKRKELEAQKPEYVIPQEAKDQLSESQNRIIEGLPAESKKIFAEQMLSRQATGLNQMAERKSGLLGVAQNDMTATAAMNKLTLQDASMRLQQEQMRRADIARARGEMISQDETVYQEKMAGFTDERNMLAAEQGSGMQNMWGGVQGAAQSGILGANGGLGGSSGTTDPSAGGVTNPGIYGTETGGLNYGLYKGEGYA